MATDPMRTTIHNGRSNKHGVYSPKHNDRNFDTETDEHIDPERSTQNYISHIYDYDDPNLTFDEAEARFYNEFFTSALTARNETYRKNGHKERVKDMNAYRNNKASCPEEIIYQIGNTDQTVDAAILKDIVFKQLNWEQKQFPQAQLLNVAVHVDEQGAPHAHIRRVWCAETENGYIVNQNKALKQMGIQRPNPEKKESRYNNAKMTYSKMCREHFNKLCIEAGLEIETEPKEKSRTGLTLVEYKARQEWEKVEKQKEELNEQEQLIEQQRKENQEYHDNLYEWECNVLDLQKSVDKSRKQLKQDRQKLEQEQTDLEQRKETLDHREKDLQQREASLRVLEAKISDEKERQEKEYMEQLEKLKTTINEFEDVHHRLMNYDNTYLGSEWQKQNSTLLGSTRKEYGPEL